MSSKRACGHSIGSQSLRVERVHGVLAGFGILLVEPLNLIRVGGFKLGFWFAQQGSIYVFLVLIFFYAWRMNKLDKRHGVDERDEGDA